MHFKVLISEGKNYDFGWLSCAKFKLDAPFPPKGKFSVVSMEKKTVVSIKMFLNVV